MTLNNLRENIKKQLELSKELKYFGEYINNNISQIPEVRRAEEELFKKTAESLIKQVRIINNSLPELINNILIARKLPSSKTAEKKDEEKSNDERVKGLIKIQYNNTNKKPEAVTLKKDDREKYVKELRISKELINKLKGRIEKKSASGGISLQKPNFYGKISNFFFRSTSKKMLDKGYFRNLNTNLRKSNSSLIINTYVSIMLFTISWMIIISIGLAYLLTSIGWLGTNNEPITLIIKQIGVVLAVEFLTWIIIYFSPAMDVSVAGKKIDQELPFVTVHMAAIAGSGIEPSKIFSIIVASDDYPNTRKEIIKLINQINYYGYDLVNALKNVARSTSSEKLSELFKGLATTISGGGSLEAFLHKRAESLLLDYRLDREKYTKIAENFMNIYIALVIAAPMIFLLLLILIGISGTGLSYTPFQLSIMIISAVIIINIIFLVAINAKQPTY